MRTRTGIGLAIVLLLAASGAVAMKDNGQVPDRAAAAMLGGLKAVASNEPLVLTSGGDTTWIQVHSASTYCPGDPYLGHGTEAAAGPGPLGTWCFEGG
ncbi:MAG: hypothetical protein WAW06_08350, partial [bacterium]